MKTYREVILEVVNLRKEKYLAGYTDIRTPLDTIKLISYIYSVPKDTVEMDIYTVEVS